MDESQNNYTEWKKSDDIECLLYDSNSGKYKLISRDRKQNSSCLGIGMEEGQERSQRNMRKLWKVMGVFIFSLW